jgi:predicted dehydrogenase
MPKEVGFVRMGEVEEAREIKEIGVGMLGYAFMGKAHTNAFIKMPIFFYPPPAKPRLVAIFGRSEAKVREAARRFGYKKYYTSWEGLIKDPEVEIVDNGLPNNMHHDPCILAAEQGKHIICEKPLARTGKEAEEMYRAAEKAGIKHMTAFNYRFVPAIRFAKQLIDEGYIGKILQFRGVYLQEWIMDPNFPLVWRLRRDIAGSGALGDLGSHVIDLARFLVGEIDSLTSSPPWMVRIPVSAGRFGLHPSSLGGLALGRVSSPLPLSQVGLGVMHRPFIIATGSKKSNTHHQK